MRKIQILAGTLLLFMSTFLVQAQSTFPVNGVTKADREGSYAFTNAVLVEGSTTTIPNATLVIRDGKIVGAGTGIAIPKDAVVIDCKGKFIYLSFIDIYSDYGMPASQRAAGGFNFGGPSQMTNNQKGAYG